MNDNAFDLVEQAARSGGSEAAFHCLLERLRQEKKYAQLFQARLMKKRHELGLPLIPVEPLDQLPEDTRRAYEEGFVQAARDVGRLFLADGDISGAWPYFRELGEIEPVAKAIEEVHPQPGIDRVIEIAFFERANPRKGLELILANYGVCRAITCFFQYPERKGREECIRLLIRTLHQELVRNLKRIIRQDEGKEPETDRIPALIAGRDWLFEGNNYHIDTSHLVSVFQLSLELSDRETLEMAAELAEYGRHLSPLFQHRCDPPFQNVYADHAIYLRALLGEDVEAALAHFRAKLAESDPSRSETGPAQALVRLLARLSRYDEAIDVSLQYLKGADTSQLACPSLAQLCQLSGDPNRLMKLAREQGDLVTFTAAALQG